MIHAVVFMAAAIGMSIVINKSGPIVAFIHRATAPRVPPTPPEIGTTWVSRGSHPWASGVTVKDVKDGWVKYMQNWDGRWDFCVLKQFVRKFPVQKTT